MTYADDLEKLLLLYDAGEQLSDSVMQQGEHKKLFIRARHSAGGSWTKVFFDLRELRPGLEFRRFFVHAPKGIFASDDGAVLKIEASQQEVNLYAEDCFKKYAQASPDNSLITMLAKEPELRRLYTRLFDQGQNPREIFDHATGRASALPGRGKSGFMPPHLLGGMVHPKLRSRSELIVDNVLHAVVEDYENIHAHSVNLKLLVDNIPWSEGPYKTPRSATADILVGRRVVVEVSFMTERLSPGYRDRMAWKLGVLRSAGYKAYNIRIEDGGVANAQIVASILDDLNLPAKPGIEELFWREQPGEEIPTVKLSRAKTPAQKQEARTERQAKSLVLPKQSKAERAREMAATGWSPEGIQKVLALPKQAVKVALQRPRGAHVDWDAEPELGKVSDQTLATRHGVHPTTVVNARQRRGIPAYRDTV